jgi:hypothetical protein
VIEASCHCGAVKITLSRAPDTLTDCNCSICRRLGALWAYYAPAEVQIAAADDAMGAYAWGERSLAFHHCRTCGCTTHWAGIDPSGAAHPAGVDPKSGRMGVNARLLAPADRAAAKVRRFDGADTWRVLED